MKPGFRLEGQIGNGNDRSFRNVKNIWEYTAGDIADKGVGWLSQIAPNAEMLTRAEDEFHRQFKSAGNLITLAVPEMAMRGAPYTERQSFQSFSIIWYDKNQSYPEFWRIITFYQVTVKRVTSRDFSKIPNMGIRGNYSEVVMHIAANIEFK